MKDDCRIVEDRKSKRWILYRPPGPKSSSSDWVGFANCPDIRDAIAKAKLHGYDDPEIVGAGSSAMVFYGRLSEIPELRGG